MFDYQQKCEFQPGKIIEIQNALKNAAPIFLGYDIEQQFADTLERIYRHSPPDRIFMLTDPFLFDTYGHMFLSRLHREYPEAEPYLLPRGEKSKTLDVLQKLCDWLVEKGVSKRSLLVAFGGGSIGNITGLAAGLIFRGIRFVEVPTTLSHQTDGVLSNKQAVNGKFGKNHFGIYHAPMFSWADTRYIETETSIFKKSGIVEGIKNGLIDQSDFIPYLDKNLRADGEYTPEQINDLSYKLIISKLEILKKDPTERQYGIILEYGHTFAHAVEWLSEGVLTHGESVSIGMKIAAEISHRLGYLDAAARDLHYRLIDDKLAMKPELPPYLDASSLIRVMYVDNKKTGRDMRFVLLEAVGRCRKGRGDYLIRVDKSILKDVIDVFLDHYPGRYRN